MVKRAANGGYARSNSRADKVFNLLGDSVLNQLGQLESVPEVRRPHALRLGSRWR